ncbi:MAG: glycoside hydrolase family 16 protein [Verrucomicrobiales bacterium]|nr:glycoside hydrolase family 16 protein [Verrucomicrobiales bacterium]
MKLRLLLAAVLGGFLTRLSAAEAPVRPPAGWVPVWSDEFNQPDGSAPDPSRWVFDLGGNGWGNEELQTYTARRENSRIEKGHLVIEARRESFTGPDQRRREFTSARLKTLGRFSVTYGRIEARIQVPKGKGLWPAFWTLGTNVTTVGWPRCGEIDILENIGREPDQVHGTVHGPGYSAGAGPTRAYRLPGGTPFADAFHVYSVEWDLRQIRWFVDDTPYFTLTPAQLPSGTDWVFDQPQFLLLNLAVGGRWPGPPDASTPLPQEMKVDYVRVYRRAP